MYHVTSVVRGLALMAMMLLAMTSTLLADGNETLGPPSISIAAGSGYVSAGVGLSQSQPGIININVPAGATINQVLIYWEGQYTTANGDDAITVGGNNVQGTLIGGPDYFFSNNGGTLPVYSSTYRADITSLALVSAGANAISVSDLNNDIANNGAGIFVIYSDGLPNTEIQLVDGNDLAYKFFPNPRGTMVAQTFTFTAASTPRTAKLSMFFSSVQGILSTGGVLRPNEVSVTVGATTTTYTNELLSNDGQEWDTMTKLINIPAGETQLTVEALSGPGGDEDPNTTDPQPASFAWNAAGLSIQCTGKIGDFVFRDGNCDGNQAGDTGIPNVIVTLKQGNTVLATTTTDANGHYEFDGLCLGEYTVEVDATSLPAGYTPTTCSNTPGIGDNSNCSPSTVVLTENNTEDLTIDFGYCEPPPPCTGKIGNFVWKDSDCDGTQEGGEPGIANVTVQLLDAAGVNVLKTTTTNASGYYLFDSLCADAYTVKVVAATLPAGYTPTTCSNVANNNTNSNCSPSPVVLVNNNSEDLTIDFGYCAPPECSGKIGNFVWKDLNCNGTQNSGEPGIPNVTIKLYRGATLVATTTTDASGYYSFNNLCADCYTVKVDASTLPAGYTPTTCSNVANNNTNSNCSPTQVVLVNNNSQDLTIDFGYCAPPPCVPGTFVFCGNSSTSGSYGNIRTFTVNGVSVKASAFSRKKTTATWETAYLGSYSYGLGVTDRYEGSGSNGTHRVDNTDKNNYILFEFSTPVVVSRTYLDAIVTDSDISVWYGTLTDPFNNHVTLSDAVLSGLLTEQNATSSSSARWASFNGGQVVVNALVIAADVQDTSPEDCFKVRKVEYSCVPAPPPPPCVSGTFNLTGNSSTSGSYGNIRTFTVNGVSVKASAFSRNKTSATWETAYLGSYSSGLGVTDRYEGSGSDGSHRTDNIDKNNYILFEFSNPVVVRRAYLDAIVTDSDISVWYGTLTDPFNNHVTLSDAVLSGLLTEQNATSSSSARWASFNGGQVVVNALVIAADVQDTSPEDWFKVRHLEFACVPSGSGAPGMNGEQEEEGVDVGQPQETKLLQNFPNPFNPTTEIHFELREDQATTLKIFNTLGQEIKTLVNGDLKAGAYTYSWDATDNSGSRVASGVYFYRFTAGDFVSMKKMSLLK